VQRLVTVIVLVVLLVVSVLFGLSDRDISVADTSILNEEVTTRQIQATNSSASATIMITMYTGD